MSTDKTRLKVGFDTLGGKTYEIEVEGVSMADMEEAFSRTQGILQVTTAKNVRSLINLAHITVVGIREIEEQRDETGNRR